MDINNNDILHTSLLFDFYSGLLTDKQCQIYELYYHDDLSMQEIGDINGISKQGVNDILKRTTKKLDGFEKKLGLVSKHLDIALKIEKLDKCVKDIEVVANENDGMCSLSEINELKKIIDEIVM